MTRRFLALFLALAMLIGFTAAGQPVTAAAPAGTQERFAPFDPYDLMPGDFFSFAPPTREVLNLLQPDGSMVEVRLNPMEHGGQVETLDGYTVIQNEEGWWTYATLGDGIQNPAGKVVPSSLKVGKDLPKGIAKKVGTHKSIFEGADGQDTRDAMFDAIHAVSSPNASMFTMNEPEPKIYRYVVVLVEFQDVKFQPHQTREWFQERISGLGTSPTGTVTDFYHENSYGRFIPHLDVYGPYTSIRNLSYYDYQLPGQSSRNVSALLTEVFPQMQNEVDWEVYDNDKVVFTSGTLQFRSVDMVVVIQAGPGKEATGTPGHIWSHATTANIRTGQYGPDGRELRIRATNINPGIGFNIGVVSHEMGHSIGEPDYYATNYLSAGTGDWDVMAGGSWLGNDPAGSNPVHHNPFVKIRQGWIEPQIVTDTTMGVTLRPRSTHPDLIMIPLGGSGTGTTNADERIFIEYISNRAPGAIFDKAAPGSGILIWHYDAGGSNNTAARYRLAVQEYDFRDGTQELRLNLNRGEPTDPWSDTAIGMTPYTTPNTNRNTTFGGTRFTGWNIVNISPLGPTMSLDLIKSAAAGPVTADRPALSRQPVIAGDGPVNLTTKLINNTGAALQNVQVEFMALVGSTWIKVAETTLPTLAPAVSTTVTGAWAEPFAGKFQVEARIAGMPEAVTEAGTIRIFERPARVLLVDDDDGYGVEEAFEGALTSLGVPYVSVTGTASLATMQQYDLVIWSAGQTGRQAGQLDQTEIAALKAYLNGGGKLWMSSPRLGAAMASTGSAPGVDPAMYRDYFGSAYPMSSQKSGGTITGLGHPVGGLDTFAIRAYPGREIQDFIRQGNSQIGTVEPLFSWSLGDYMGMEVTGNDAHNNFRVIYFGFNLAQVIQGADRLALTQQVLDRMGIATVYFDKATYLMQSAGSAKITVRDAAATGPSITVQVTSGANADGVPVTLSMVSPGLYAGNLNLQKNNSRANNTLRVNDTDVIRVTYGEQIWATANVLLKADKDRPATIHHDQIFDTTDNAPLPVLAVVTDDIRVQRVDLYYRIAGTGAFTRVRMEETARDAYMTTIPAAMITPAAVEYYITATDSAGNVTTHGTAAKPYFIVVQPRTLGQ